MFTLPEINYSYQALEPYIDAQTMHLHHTAHHQTYINKLNDALNQVNLTFLAYYPFTHPPRLFFLLESKRYRYRFKGSPQIS